MLEDKPWLQRKSWASNEIASEGRQGQWVLWAFALIWNLLTLPMLWQVGDLWRQIDREPITALAFLFPLVGAGLLIAAVRMTLNRRHFGPVPVFLDPFPGSLAGQVGGHIDTSIPYDPDQRFTVSLTCVRSYTSGSGKNRSRSESVKWQGDGVCHTEPDGAGTRLSFRFDLPGDLPAADVKRGKSYHLWRVTIGADLDGPDFHRRYDIPVFATGGQLSTVARGTESHADTADLAMEGVEAVADIHPVSGGIEAYFPAARRPLSELSSLVMGLMFGGIGLGVFLGGESYVFSTIFMLIGGGLLLAGVFGLGKSLRVMVTREGVRARRFLFGYPLWTRQWQRSEVGGLKFEQRGWLSIGNKRIVFYRLIAVKRGDDRRRLVLAERLQGRSEAELLLNTFRTYLG